MISIILSKAVEFFDYDEVEYGIADELTWFEAQVNFCLWILIRIARNKMLVVDLRKKSSNKVFILYGLILTRN